MPIRKVRPPTPAANVLPAQVMSWETLRRQLVELSTVVDLPARILTRAGMLKVRDTEEPFPGNPIERFSNFVNSAVFKAAAKSLGGSLLTRQAGKPRVPNPTTKGI